MGLFGPSKQSIKRSAEKSERKAYLATRSRERKAHKSAIFNTTGGRGVSEETLFMFDTTSLEDEDLQDFKATGRFNTGLLI